MLELNLDDLDIYKKNLNEKKKSFTLMKKRNELNLFVDGKPIAKFKNKNSLHTLEKNESKGVLNLFATVKKSINKYLQENNFEVKRVYKKYDSTFSNRILFDSLPIGCEFYYVDVKHCYWRIAYLKGYISEYFYLKVLENPELKIFRNMALSCIIAPKMKEYYEDGNLIWSVEEDTSIYNDVYESIRFTAWNIFGSLAFEKLGKEKTIGYFTDGIMIFKEDLPSVKAVLARHKLQYKLVRCVKTEHRFYLNTETNQNRRF